MGVRSAARPARTEVRTLALPSATMQNAYASSARDYLPQYRYPEAALGGVLMYIGQARRAIAARDVPGAHEALITAQQVVALLRASLEPAAYPELAERLEALYGFILDQLREANLTKTVGPLDAVTPVVLTLRQAWERAAERVSGAAGTPAAVSRAR